MEQTSLVGDEGRSVNRKGNPTETGSSSATAENHSPRAPDGSIPDDTDKTPPVASDRWRREQAAPPSIPEPHKRQGS